MRERKARKKTDRDRQNREDSPESQDQECLRHRRDIVKPCRQALLPRLSQTSFTQKHVDTQTDCDREADRGKPKEQSAGEREKKKRKKERRKDRKEKMKKEQKNKKQN